MGIASIPTYATGDVIESAWANTMRDNTLVLDARTGGDPGAAGKLPVSNGVLSAAWLTPGANAQVLQIVGGVPSYGQVGAANLADNAVTNPKILDTAINTAKLQDNAVNTAKLADNAVTTPKIALLNVGAGQIADGAITTAKLADLNVTAAKIATAAVTSTKIADNNVGAGQLADGSVTTAKIPDDAVNAAKILAGSITTAKIADTNVTTAKIALLAVGSGQLADGAVTNGKLADGAVNAVKITDGSVTTAKLPDNAITNPKLADAAVGTAELVDGAVTDVKVATANKDGATGTASMRTLGTGAAQAAAGNHGHANPANMAKTFPGTYSGNSSTNNITSVPFAPTLVIIVDSTTATLLAVVCAGIALVLPAGGSSAAPGVTFTANGFNLSGTSGGINTTGHTYSYVAFG